MTATTPPVYYVDQDPPNPAAAGTIVHTPTGGLSVWDPAAGDAGTGDYRSQWSATLTPPTDWGAYSEVETPVVCRDVLGQVASIIGMLKRTGAPTTLAAQTVYTLGTVDDPTLWPRVSTGAYHRWLGIIGVAPVELRLSSTGTLTVRPLEAVGVVTGTRVIIATTYPCLGG